MFAPEIIVPLASFCAVAVATYALLALFDPYWLRVQDRIEHLQQPQQRGGCAGTHHATATATVPGLFDALHRLLPTRAGGRPELRQRLTKAGIYHQAAVPRFFAARLLMLILFGGLTVGVGAAGYVRMDQAVLSACAMAGLGWMLPSLWLDRAVARHHVFLRKSLPDFLDLMIVCLEGGLSLQETIRRVSEELRLAHPALAMELSIVQRDIELGACVDQALKRFAARTDYEGVRTLSTFIREAQRFGTNITEALRSHADMLRSQREQAAEEQAQKAAVKILLPTLLLIFPAIFVVAVGPAVIQIQEAFANK
jgi:tight adherence protein C